MHARRMHPKFFTLLSSATVALTLLMLLAACGTTPTTSGNKSAGDIHVGFVSETSSLNFASEMAAGAQFAAKQFGVNAQIVAPPNIDDQAAVNLFQNLVKTAPDGIAVETLAPALFVRPFADAVGKGIPIIAVDTTPAPGSNVTSYVGNDNIAAGALLADEAINQLPSSAKGSVVIGIDTPGVPVLTFRFQGMQQEFQRLRPDLQVIGPLDSKQEPQENFDAWNNIIKAHPEGVAFLGVGDTDNASLAKIKQANNGTYLTGAFDLNPDGLEAVKNGVNFGLVDPEHFLKGYVAMRMLIEHAMHGTAIPKGWWNPGAVLVTRSNVQAIIDRQATLDTKGAYYKPTFDMQFANPTAYIKPLDQAK